MAHTKGWIGVDLDGTLAHYASWDGGKVGPPIPLMVERVKRWLAANIDVRIVTARVAGADADSQRTIIQDWTTLHIGRPLPVTCSKDFAMIELWDDRAVQVIPNTGKRIDGSD